MSLEILVNINKSETRIALIENSSLQEIYIERESNLGLVGNIYKGKIVRVLPGMQAAFVDIGLEKAAFLHFKDLDAKFSGADIIINNKKNIQKKMREGEEIVVQIVKDPIGKKGAKVTSQLSISARDLIYIPSIDKVGVSLKIKDEAERDRLRNIILKDISLPKGGFIIRTAAEGASCLNENRDFLLKQWEVIQQNIQKTKYGEIIYQDLKLLQRTLRDVVTINIDRIRIDDKNQLKIAEDFVSKYIPDFHGLLEYYNQERPIFDLYNIEDEINKALQRKVQLKSGGYLVFDQTEAMTTIDVNTGAFVGKKNLEETIYKTNLEAVHSICRQIKLRNIGGIIIIDFIDMLQKEHKRQVIRALEKELVKDRHKTDISEVSALGLVQMTRKRNQESLANSICHICPTCDGRGKIKSIETVCLDIIREIYRSISSYPVKKILILSSAAITDRFVEDGSQLLDDLAKNLKTTINFQVESCYTDEQFDVVIS